MRCEPEEQLDFLLSPKVRNANCNYFSKPGSLASGLSSQSLYLCSLYQIIRLLNQLKVACGIPLLKVRSELHEFSEHSKLDIYIEYVGHW